MLAEGFWLGVLLGALAAWVLPQIWSDARREWRNNFSSVRQHERSI